MIARGWSSHPLAEVARVVRDRTGLVFPESRRGIAEDTIRKSMARVGLSDPERYAAILAEGGAALDSLVAELTVGETYFFRESAQLEFIRATIIPEILRRRGQAHVLRIWSAGCASGEEPYSLAIMLHEMGLGARARIVGTEISRPRLAAARQARYGQWSMRGVPTAVVARWFARRDSRYVLDPAIRSMVEFRYLNLAEDTYPASSTGIWGMDLILCRNVFIYFDADTVGLVASRLMSSLSDVGWLVLGASDPMLSDVVPCEVVMTGAGLAYRRSRDSGVREEGGEMRPREARPAQSEVIDAGVRDAVASRFPLPSTSTPFEAYEIRDYTRAAELARALVRDRPDDVAPRVLLVRSLANAGRLEEAGEACAAAVEQHRASAELAYLHSLLLGEGGRYGDAAAAARRALYLDRSLIVAHLALGSALTRTGDLGGAQRAFANAAELLERMPPAAIVPASDGERVFRLLEIVRVQGALLRGDAA